MGAPFLAHSISLNMQVGSAHFFPLSLSYFSKMACNPSPKNSNHGVLIGIGKFMD